MVDARRIISGMSPQKRVFSEQETSEVLQKAAKLQEAASDAAYTPGITRSELDRIASEAGIDTKFVEQALGEIQTTKPKRSWLNLSEEFERVVDGEVDPDDFDQILLDLKPVGHRHGLQQVGRTVSMQTYYKGAVCQVEMTSRAISGSDAERARAARGGRCAAPGVPGDLPAVDARGGGPRRRAARSGSYSPTSVSAPERFVHSHQDF